MLRKNTDQIIGACLDASKEYSDLCQQRLFSPSKESINRKVEFLKLISELKENTPEESFIKIYDFYLSQNPSSDLRKIIEDKLMWILDIPEPKFTGIAQLDARNAQNTVRQRKDTFHEKISNLRDAIGITDKNEVLLMSM